MDILDNMFDELSLDSINDMIMNQHSTFDTDVINNAIEFNNNLDFHPENPIDPIGYMDVDNNHHRFSESEEHSDYSLNHEVPIHNYECSEDKFSYKFAVFHTVIFIL